MRSITAAEFRLWLTHSRAGERLHYFKGHLAHDREGVINMLSASPKHVRFDPQNTMADEVYKAYQRGMVHLVQYRLGPNEWDYVAERRPAHITNRRHHHAH